MTRALLDTQALLWLLTDDPRLGSHTRDSLRRHDAVLVSAASLWELSIKHSVGKFPDPEPLIGAIQKAGLILVPVLPVHAVAVRTSPLEHRDPFDRMLLAQAMSEGCEFVTADSRILATPVAHLVDATE